MKDILDTVKSHPELLTYRDVYDRLSEATADGSFGISNVINLAYVSYTGTNAKWVDLPYDYKMNLIIIVLAVTHYWEKGAVKPYNTNWLMAGFVGNVWDDYNLARRRSMYL